MNVFSDRCSVNLLLVLIWWLCWQSVAPRVYFSSTGFLRHRYSFAIFLFPLSYHLCWKLIHLLARNLCWPCATQSSLTVFADFQSLSFECSMTKQSLCRRAPSHSTSVYREGMCMQHGLGSCKTHVQFELSLAAVCLYCTVTATSPSLFVLVY